MKRVFLFLLLIGVLLLSGCSDDEELKAGDLQKRLDQLELQVKNQEDIINNQKKIVEEQGKLLQQIGTYLQSQSTAQNKQEPTQQQMLENAVKLTNTFINIKSVKTKEEFANIAEKIIMEPAKYLEANKDTKLGVYSVFKGQYTNESIKQTNNNSYIFEALLTGSVLNNETQKEEAGKYNVKIEFALDKKDNFYKIVNASLNTAQ